ncbi:MAG: hypothetical protein UT24_C0017G0002 [Candidatus Woesebacteria bacterium GW2011_GWB1_39_12]|uniref:Uncharacterized protein n=2 Tax=Candidatus Woeseibacteriota TaxID=1752722 RepID=A0A0G0Q8F2_9BACT|nr:MAG: hypothetical protein UT23_C0006G0022 [Candidatus Woesebacteria bacterium GW2011_GWA1_39_12]KKR00076.1 MAG: hypothetical protein UT24_C0017G0002 [Candidatus Woesebacteria bacterium GW2011_GWB1_39_12]
MSDESAKEGEENMSNPESRFNIGTPPENIGAFDISSQAKVPDIRMQFDPSMTPGMDQQPLSQLEQQDAHERELRRIAEVMYKSDYRSTMTIIGADLITEIQGSVEAGDFERLQKNILKALPLAEGLEFGIFAESYGIPIDTEGLTDEQKQRRENNAYAKLRNMFLTVEDSVDRGNVGYLRDAMLDATSRPIRELEEWDQDGGITWEQNRRTALIDSYNRENLNRIINKEKPLSKDEIETKVNEAVTFLKEFHKERFENIRKNKARLLELDLHVKSRFTFDSAFRMRQYVAHDRDLQSNMKQSVGLGAAEPDGTHWQGFFQVEQEWGEGVDRTLRELVRMGEEGFYQQNLDGKQFKTWVDRGLDASKINGKRRMDVFWAAWRQFCFMELAGKFGMKIEDGKMNFSANPPYVGDLATWLSNPEEHRATEFKWNWATFKQARDNPSWNGMYVGERPDDQYRAISHSGHSRGIGHLTKTPPPTDKDPFQIARFGKWAVGNYMEFATLQQGPNKGRNLYELWHGYYDNQGSWVEGISMADIRFPWIDTDFAGAKTTSDEAPSGSVGYWFLQRGRSLLVLKENLGVPDLKEFSSISYISKLRNWSKLSMVYRGKFMENPAYVKIYTDILFFKGFSSDVIEKIEKGLPISELELTATDYREMIGSFGVGQKYEGVNLTNYLINAYNARLIDHGEFLRLKQIKPRS